MPPAFPPVDAGVLPRRRDGQRKRERFSEEQSIRTRKGAEAGAAVTDPCRRHGMSSATYCAWKAKFGAIEVSDAKGLRAL
ncbi:transposase [Sphingomonas hengshuiensis]|uniref:transposase n=1 Tax=Sphingomonas hengshuiensis TaxID=1609977 RepID=UPI000AA4D280|nr:transposase [Sphingomonas hengshuiensis]